MLRQERCIATKSAPSLISLILLAKKKKQKQESNGYFEQLIETEVKTTTFAQPRAMRITRRRRLDCRIEDCCRVLENPPTCKEMSPYLCT